MYNLSQLFNHLGNWQPRYYFDLTSGQCQLFWWDSCLSKFSRNYFTDLLNCQWLCQQDSKTHIPSTITPQHSHRQHHLKKNQNLLNSIFCIVF